ncbi:2-hydroxyacid dehydrogenase [Pseudomonas matsuisoli]|uniref:Hydroxyacid dehydrogenase n=1 Tax=Pseudomonas matsuisoli TaxID=1515666 RepID=A0A917PVB4_9PSED|nr:2-hydroxyacid dehydrogenase [Pseudomonas matsuisoli]GGJ93461.1 hydroxyacid dehydrogenase [Pseudomonas matsuisoli]
MSQASQRPQLLMMGQLLPALVERIEQTYDVHRFWEVQDKTAWLKANADKIDGIATSGVFGAKKELIDALPKLKAIISFGVGYDSIDIGAARDRGVIVTNTPGVLDNCVADTAFSILLALGRRVCEADRFVRAGQWPQGRFPLSGSIGGKVCGIVGLGNIGRAIAKRAEAFGMTIAYHNRSRRNDVDYTYHETLEGLLEASDYAVLVVPGGGSTDHLIGAEQLKALGPKGYLVNIARGSVVDQDALIGALKDGTIAGAALDVFADEPNVPADLMGMDNVVLTPHIGSGTHETRQAMADLFYDNLEGVFRRGEAVTQVR